METKGRWTGEPDTKMGKVPRYPFLSYFSFLSEEFSGVLEVFDMFILPI